MKVDITFEDSSRIRESIFNNVSFSVNSEISRVEKVGQVVGFLCDLLGVNDTDFILHELRLLDGEELDLLIGKVKK